MRKEYSSDADQVVENSVIVFRELTITEFEEIRMGSVHEILANSFEQGLADPELLSEALVWVAL